ncbi:MAG: polysaccharide deacetylase family protein [Patescibacteria group bacterium]
MKKKRPSDPWTQTIKRGFASLFVCVFVLVLPFLFIKQWRADLGLLETNKATPLPAFIQRPADTDQPTKIFEEPLISITFDDGWETDYSVAAPLLMKDGIRSTHYIVTGLLGDPAYMSLDQVKALKGSGQQVACHTVTHPDLTKIDATQLNNELEGCRKFFLQEDLGDTKDFAAPYGHTNQAATAAINHFFRSARNTDGDLSNDVTDADVNLPSNFNVHNVIGVTVRSTTTIAELQQAVQYATEHKAWLVLTYHQAEEEGSKFSLSSRSLKKQLDYLSSTSIRIVTVGKVMDDLERSN